MQSYIRQYGKNCFDPSNIGYLVQLCDYFINGSLELTNENLTAFERELELTCSFQWDNALLELIPIIDDIRSMIDEV